MAGDSLDSAPPGRKRRALAEGVVRVGPLMGLPGLLRDLGSDPEPVFAAAGFNTDQFADPDFEIPFVAGSRLLARCVAATGCGHLGLLLGERADPSSLGIAGFMLRTAPDVGSALRALANYLDLHDRGAVVTLASKESEISLSYAIHLWNEMIRRKPGFDKDRTYPERSLIEELKRRYL